MKKFKAPVIKEQSPIERVITYIKNENSYFAIKFMLETMKPIERAEFATKLLAASKFRGFRLAMTKFVELIKESSTTDTRVSAEKYRKELTFDQETAMYDFANCRAWILDDLLHNNYSYCLNAILLIVLGVEESSILENIADSETYKEFCLKLKPVAADLAGKLYPEAIGLKILFGGK